MTIAVYPGTFDPITYGHLDVIDRASHLFDTVIVAIAKNSSKAPLFTLEERVNLTAKVLQLHANIRVQGFDTLLYQFVQQCGAHVILRGLRTVTDFDYEFQLASMNRVLNPRIESIFLMPAEKYMCISSSLVREIAAFGGDVTSFVPPLIVDALQKRFTLKQDSSV